MDNVIELKSSNRSVRIEKGELVGFIFDGHEFIHQKGSPGWGSSDTEMFPIIGPVSKAGFMVKTPRGHAKQDQHGHLRQMEYSLVSSDDTTATFSKSYESGTKIRNSKYPKKSSVEFMDWPYDFEFKKSYKLTDHGLEIDFLITSENGMPYMLGYHPAFKLYTSKPEICYNSKKISLQQVLDVGSRAFQVANCDSIILKDKKEITIKTQGFGHFMCWTEVNNMVCIEPISFYPYAVSQQNLHKGFKSLGNEAKFKVTLSTKA